MESIRLKQATMDMEDMVIQDMVVDMDIQDMVHMLGMGILMVDIEVDMEAMVATEAILVISVHTVQTLEAAATAVITVLHMPVMVDILEMIYTTMVLTEDMRLLQSDYMETQEHFPQLEPSESENNLT